MQWLTNGLKSLSNFQLLAVAGVLSLACIAGSFGAGYLYGARQEARHQVKEITKTVYVPVQEIKEVQVRNVQTERRLAEELKAISLEAESLRNELANRPNDPACTVDPVNVRLLNAQIANGAPPGSPGQPVSETGTVTCRDLELWADGAATRYNRIAKQLTELIEWSDRELIQPQQ